MTTSADEPPTNAAPLEDPRTAIPRIRQQILALLEELGRYYLYIPPNSQHSVGVVSSRRRRALPIILEMVRHFPMLGVTRTPEELEADMSIAVALGQLSTDFEVHRVGTDDTSRILESNAWSDAAASYAAAQRKAPTNSGIKVFVERIQEVLKQGPRVETSARVAAQAETSLVKATHRAASAQQKAATKKQKAEAHLAAHLARAPGTGKAK